MLSSKTTGLPRSDTVFGTVTLRALAIFWILVSGNPGLRQDLSAAVTEEYELRVQPRVCVVLSSDALCTMQLEVSWSAPRVSDVCLKLAHADATLRCWEQARVGEIELELQRQSDTVVQLLDAASNTVLSEAEVTIVSRDLRDSRRRRRHVWSII